MRRGGPIAVVGMLVCLSCLFGCSGPDAKKVKFYEKAKAHFAKGDVAKAGIELKNAIQIDPKYAVAYQLMGRVELKKGDIKNAYANFKKAAELDPADQDSRLQMARIFLMVKSPDDALKQVEEVLKLNPQNEDAHLTKCAVLIAKKDNAQASAYLEKLAAQGIKKPDLFTLLATVYAGRNDKAGAESALRKGISLNANSVDLHLMLAALCRDKGNRDESIALLRKVVTLEPDNANHRITLAAVLWDMGSKDDSRKTLNEMVAKDPANEVNRLRASAFLAERGDVQGAEQELRTGLQQKGHNYKIRFALTELLANSGRLDQAVTMLKETAALDTSNKDEVSQAKTALARIALGNSQVDEASMYIDEVLKDAPKQMDARLLKGKIHLLKKEGSAAVAEFRSVVADSPQSLEAIVLLAEAHLLSNEPKLAWEKLQNAQKIAPDNQKIQQTIARYHIAGKRFSEAEKMYGDMLAKHPEDLETRVLLGDLMRLTGNLKRAEAEYTLVKNKAPGIPIGYVKMSELALQRGNMAGSIKELEQAVQRNPGSEQLTAVLVQLYRSSGAFDKALAVLQNQIKAKPQAAGNYVKLAQTYGAQRNYAEARRAYEKAISMEPKNWSALNDLAFLLSETGVAGDLKSAAGYAEKAAEIRPDDPMVLDTKGWIHYRQGEMKKAVELLAKAQAASANNPTVNYHLGMAYQRSGEKAKAREYLTKAVSSKGTFSGKEEAVKTLGML